MKGLYVCYYLHVHMHVHCAGSHVQEPVSALKRKNPSLKKESFTYLVEFLFLKVVSGEECAILTEFIFHKP